jgi:hypothetical protein
MSSTGQIVGGIVGAVVGFFVGGPSGALYGAQLGIMAGGLIDPAKVQGPRLEDLTAQTSTYGAFIPRIYGTVAVHGNVMWIQGDRLIERSSTASGKGGPDVESFDYFATFAVSLCEGPIAGVRRIWVGGQLWYDAGSDDLATIIASSNKSGMFTLYTGSETQQPDPLIQADRGSANVPAYRGLAYIVFNGLPLKDVGNSLAGAQIKVEVIKDGSLSTAHALAGQIGAPTQIPGAIAPLPNLEDMTAFYPVNAGSGKIDTTVYRYVLDSARYKAAFQTTGYIGACLLTNADTPVFLMTLSSDKIYRIFDDAGELTEFYFGGVWYGYTETRAAFRDYMLYIGGAAANTKVMRLDIYGRNAATSPVLPLGVSSIGVADSLIFCPRYANGTFVVYVLDRETLDLVDTYTDASVTLNGTNRVYAESDSVFYVLTSVTSVLSRIYRVVDGVPSLWAEWPVGISSASGNQTFSVRGNLAIICNPNGTPNFGRVYVVYRTIASTPADLADIVETECLKSELLTAADLDVTDLAAEVRGYRIGSLGPLRGGVDPLRTAWPFDAVQHGYQIKFKARGGASVATISEAELDAREAGTGPGVQVTNVREMDTVLPSQLTLKYLDVAREYDINVAEQTR